MRQLAQTVYYGREYEEKKERQKKTKEKAEAFSMAMKNVLKQPEKNAQRDPGEKGWAYPRVGGWGCRVEQEDPASDLHESEEGKVILKDSFLTQSAPDIRGKLLKWAYGPNQSLDTLLQLAQTVYYGREYEEKKERQKKTKEKAEAFAMAMKNVLKEPEKNAQRGPGEKKSHIYVLMEFIQWFMDPNSSWDSTNPQAYRPHPFDRNAD